MSGVLSQMRAAIAATKKSAAQGGENALDVEFSPARKRTAAARELAGQVGFERIFEDGTMQVTDLDDRALFSQTLAFDDLSYQTAREEDQRRMLVLLSELLRSVGDDVMLQFNLVNYPSEHAGRERVFFEAHGDCDPELPAEYNRVLNDKMKEGVSNLRRERYLTMSVSQTGYEQARAKLAGKRSAVTARFSALGTQAHLLDGCARTDLVRKLLRPDLGAPPFSYEQLHLNKGWTTKDFCCPAALNWAPEGRHDMWDADGKLFRAIAIEGVGSRLTDMAIPAVVDLPFPMNVSIHLKPLGEAPSAEFVRAKSAYIDSEIVQRQQKAVQKGYDAALLPSDLAYAKNDADDLMEQIEHDGQKLFIYSCTIVVWATSAEELERASQAVADELHSASIVSRTMDYFQREGMNSSLPCGMDHSPYSRYLTTTQAAMASMPFATVELDDAGGGYYGQNRVSHNLTLLNRMELDNPAGFIFGTPGSGKSFSVKREITNTYLQYPGAEIIVVDPKDEYSPIISALGGAVFGLGSAEATHLNPLDLHAQAGDVRQRMEKKIEFLLAFCEQLMERQLTGVENAVIARAAAMLYMRFPDPDTQPILSDLRDMFSQQPEPEADDLATALELYCGGGFGCFDHETNVPLSRRLTCFAFKDLGTTARSMAMLMTLDYAWSRMMDNYRHGVATWLYIDEVQSFFSGGNAVFEYFNRFWSEGRAFGLVATGISQLPERILEHPEAKHLMDNSEFKLLLKQGDKNRRLITEMCGLSEQQERCIDSTTPAGAGLLIAGGARVPVEDDWPRGRLYDLWNTKPTETAADRATAAAERDMAAATAPQAGE